jgi:hypothetical protein
LVGLVDQVRVARPSGRGRPRKRLAHLIGDKAYSSRANRAALRARHIPTPSPSQPTSRPTGFVGVPEVAGHRPSTAPVTANPIGWSG